MDRDTIPNIDHVPHGSSDDFALLDFSANINPTSPDGVSDVYSDALETARRYPPEPPAAYRAAAGEYLDCQPANVIPTPGGLAAIRLTLECTISPGDSVLVPYPSFSEYAREIRLQGARPSFVQAAELLAADPSDHALAIACNPNNPTGRSYDPSRLRAFADRCHETGTVLLCDEAFLGYTDDPSLAGHPGVVVARSLTKLFGFPGLRAGFAVATGDQHRRLATARQPWNIGVPALAVGEYCLRQTDFVTATCERVRAERARLRERLEPTYAVQPSSAPFLLLDVGDRAVESVIDRAREAGVAVRDATTFRGLDSHIRVAVKGPQENDQLVEALDA